ncbi:sigma-70 family RNA polymerase sigma factor [Clostridium peptidivorans]|uniref:sigma-70 family RNA polymerase sigma factor n=1 Tax=Clostridium peptidivorans TaxID=100174 RepID=UPI00241E15AA|nr:sigma-70 family RNA polymerase sigma factor [Clostridium peptidivorans]
MNDNEFENLIKENKERLYKIAYSYVGNPEDSMDIVQEAVYKAYVKKSNLKQPEYFMTWITRILINCAMDFLKKSKKVTNLEDNFNEADKMKVSSEEIIDLYSALKELDERSKTVVVLRYFEDMTLQDISNAIELPLSTTKTILYRALGKLKIKLEGND